MTPAERLRAAIVLVQRVHWAHDSNCPHRYCHDCEPNDESAHEDCEANADPCASATCAKGAVQEVLDAALALLRDLDEEPRCGFCGRTPATVGAPTSLAWRCVGERQVCSANCEEKMLAREAEPDDPLERQGAAERAHLDAEIWTLVRELADGYDCDTGANGSHPSRCRKCVAEALRAARGGS